MQSNTPKQTDQAVMRKAIKSLRKCLDDYLIKVEALTVPSGEGHAVKSIHAAQSLSDALHRLRMARSESWEALWDEREEVTYRSPKGDVTHSVLRIEGGDTYSELYTVTLQIDECSRLPYDRVRESNIRMSQGRPPALIQLGDQMSGSNLAAMKSASEYLGTIERSLNPHQQDQTGGTESTPPPTPHWSELSSVSKKNRFCKYAEGATTRRQAIKMMIRESKGVKFDAAKKALARLEKDDPTFERRFQAALARKPVRVEGQAEDSAAL